MISEHGNLQYFVDAVAINVSGSCAQHTQCLCMMFLGYGFETAFAILFIFERSFFGVYLNFIRFTV